jgi:hypothetical protein
METDKGKKLRRGHLERLFATGGKIKKWILSLLKQVQAYAAPVPRFFHSFSHPSVSLLRIQPAAQLAVLRENPEGCGSFWVILRENPEGYVGQGIGRERNHRFRTVFDP